MMDRKGNDAKKAYIATFTGKQFFLLEPRLEDIDIIDIAHALALQCRWTGHPKFHYSVAQHSYYCSFLGPENEAFDRLMHDAPEAYIGDLNRPLKHYTEAGVAYRRQEAIIQKAIAERFGYSVVEPPSVKIADNSMLFAEKKQIMGYTFEEPQEEIRQYDVHNGIVIESWTPGQAKQMFLSRFEELYTGRLN
jgi:5'-deoxynucleotidase YfbR-like HD superfamily hydrolase